MASPQLQQVIEAIKSLAGMASGSSIEELRATNEQMARPAEPDITSEPVVANGVNAAWISAPGAAADRAVLYLHGGGYIMGSLNTHRDMMGRISRAAQTRVLGLDYRLAPEHPFPAAVDDTVAGYRFLLDQGLPPSRLAIAGDSAGGALTLAALIAGRDAGLPMPAAAVCLSPFLDLEGTGESINTRADVDPIATPEVIDVWAKAYLAGADPRTPLANPLFADLHGLPPLLIQVGDHEVLLDDSTRLAERAQAAGVERRTRSLARDDPPLAQLRRRAARGPASHRRTSAHSFASRFPSTPTVPSQPFAERRSIRTHAGGRAMNPDDATIEQQAPCSTGPPNILYVHIDNLGMGELGCYGGGILRGADTARLDRFAGEGLQLLNFAPEAQCTPTRSALLTGRYAIRSGNGSVQLPGPARRVGGLGADHGRHPVARPGTPPRSMASGTSATSPGATRPTTASTSGTASRTATTNACGPTIRSMTLNVTPCPMSSRAPKAVRSRTWSN